MSARAAAVGSPDPGRIGRRAGAPETKKVRPPLGVVDRRHALERARRRQARVLLLVSGIVVAAALTIAAAGHALVAATQIRADNLQSQLAAAVAAQQNLQLERAQLETPSRVLALAEHRFKMTAPSGVTYLEPVNPGETVLQAQEAANGTAPARARAGSSPHHARTR